MSGDLWTAVYYPKEIFNSPRAKTVLCLLFDKVIFNCPVSGMACGGGSALDDHYYGELLIEEGIIEVREEFLICDIGDEFYDTDINQYVDIQITAMALENCAKEFVIPITDDAKFKIPAFIIDEINKLTEIDELTHIQRNAKMQAAAIALSSIEMGLPPFRNLKDEEIIIAREKLSDELIAFRRSMLKLSPLIRSMINENATVRDIYAEARYLTETSIMPALSELRERIEKERGFFGVNY